MNIGKLLEHNIDTLEERQGNQALVTGIATGFSRLDQLTAGFQKSNLITICGASGIGKRALAFNLAKNAAIESWATVSIVNMSLSLYEASFRLLCCEARVDGSRIRSGFLRKEDWHKLTNAAGLLTDSSIFIHDNFQTATRIDSDMIIIDTFQRLPTKDLAPNINQEQISYAMANKLKDMALEKDIPIIVLSSLNDWQIENRENKRPRLTDFKYGYTALADISDVVISVYRDEVYNQDENNPNRGTAEITVMKQRMGPTGRVVLTFLNPYSRFEDLALDPNNDKQTGT